jgi:hypothetical protein
VQQIVTALSTADTGAERLVVVVKVVYRLMKRKTGLALAIRAVHFATIISSDPPYPLRG